MKVTSSQLLERLIFTADFFWLHLEVYVWNIFLSEPQFSRILQKLMNFNTVDEMGPLFYTKNIINLTKSLLKMLKMLINTKNRGRHNNIIPPKPVNFSVILKTNPSNHFHLISRLDEWFSNRLSDNIISKEMKIV